MKSHSRQDLQRVQRSLFLSRHDRFRDLMLSLCSEHDNLDFVRSIRRGIIDYFNNSSEDAAIDLLDIADSLSGAVHPDATYHYVANQFAALLKKYPFKVSLSKIDPEKRAYEKFERSETTCRRFNKLFAQSDRRKSTQLASTYELQQMSDYIHYVIGTSPDLPKVFSKCGFGPGANVGINGSATNVHRKLCSMWSVSPGAFDYACHSMISHAQFRELLFPEHRGFSDGSPDFVQHFRARMRDRATIAEHNNLSFVPKTTKIFRSIAVEPALNSFLQKGVDECLREFLRIRANIDLTSQEENSEMARIGSSDEEDSFVTIDLSSASDSISIELCRRVLPPDWFYLLDRIRSKSYRYKKTVNPYSKFCSMGNGFCFPLQTLLFASMCHAVGAGNTGIDYRVYGDDIIVRKQYALGLISLLRRCGFRPNESKTFIKGPFRESCGKDYYSGVNVRPVYLDYELDSLESLFKFYNSTLNCSLLSKEFFSRSRTFLFDSVPERWRFVRPCKGPEDAAFEVDVDAPLFLSSKHVRFSKYTFSWNWKELEHAPVEDRKVYCRRERHIAVLYGALMGLPSHKTFTLRRKTETKVRTSAYGVATSTWLPPTLRL